MKLNKPNREQPPHPAHKAEGLYLPCVPPSLNMHQHSQDKLKILTSHGYGMSITPELVLETISTPDQLEIKKDDKRIAQKKLNEKLVLRVIYREFSTFILIITLYLGKRTRYEKDELQ